MYYLLLAQFLSFAKSRCGSRTFFFFFPNFFRLSVRGKKLFFTLNKFRELSKNFASTNAYRTIFGQGFIPARHFSRTQAFVIALHDRNSCLLDLAVHTFFPLNIVQERRRADVVGTRRLSCRCLFSIGSLFRPPLRGNVLTTSATRFDALLR